MSTPEATTDENVTVEETATFTAPESLDGLSSEEIQEFNTKATEAFLSIYGDGGNLSDEKVEQLEALSAHINEFNTELKNREEAASARATKASELAAAAGITFSKDSKKDDKSKSDKSKDDEEEKPFGDDENTDEEDTSKKEDKKEKKKFFSISYAKPAPKSQKVVKHLPKSESETPATPDVVFSSEGASISMNELAKGIDKRLASFNLTQYNSAAHNGIALRESFHLATFSKPDIGKFSITSNDADHVNEVLDYATSESRLEGNSLVASGGWCAPSETLYDLVSEATDAGLLSVPEVVTARGGIQFAEALNYTTLSKQMALFRFSEEDDKVAKYDGKANNTTKPCFKVPCPEWHNVRLDVIGACVQAGLLQMRAYPKMIQAVVRTVLIAHANLVAMASLQAMSEGSTKVTIAANGGGTAAPVLDAVELQASHMRATLRLAPKATLEAVFPAWAYGAIRADLASRNGVELIDVTDADIDRFFTVRGISAQFVYNWQEISAINADKFIGYPNQVQFLLYPTGTWVRATADIITVQGLYDSTLLSKNDYTALFTEEGFAMLKRGADSRLVSVATGNRGTTGEQKAITTPTVDLSKEPNGV
ncbi:major capsid protein [Rothia sp. (in: high G+C Gram-positive bacteria)]|uniref:major capsid protein n=1 Tax=Rothia sp. (in: high G+C Gram-positive bacteria) TaxID=1885016 RepID=UPI001CB0504D|nr:major capsid protein [Rothia sp. (in: high G+C Gram-positive bacteria)]MBF1669209.1 major capsid protein [Rothia sp. (in: high G+C Gram-positive bacteria)]